MEDAIANRMQQFGYVYMNVPGVTLEEPLKSLWLFCYYNPEETGHMLQIGELKRYVKDFGVIKFPPAVVVGE
jgi:hypothetical protein